VSSTILNITFDCADPRALATFWGELTGWPVITEPQPGYPDCAVGTPGEGRPRLYFVKVPEAKTIKNRMHLDVIPADRTRMRRSPGWSGSAPASSATGGRKLAGSYSPTPRATSSASRSAPPRWRPPTPRKARPSTREPGAAPERQALGRLPQRDQLEAARVGNAAIMDERAGRRSR